MTCLGCDYPLAGVAANACPECGRAFDPADRKTYGPRILQKAARVLRWKPPWWLVSVYLLFTLATLGLHASPDSTLRGASGGPVVWLATTAFIAGIALPTLLLLWLACALNEDPARMSPRWFVVVFIAVAGFATWKSSLVWHTRWLRAQPAFLALSKRSPSTWKPGWYGSFYVEKVVKQPNGTVDLELGFPDLYSRGPASFSFVPNGRLPVDHGGHQWNLDDGWWIQWTSK
ncbi:MAG TPA: hypothetical protein VD971_14110 [Phycisphaerales bacterium]|nr:hypothetical protein [Phycisphaerales bacterium]